MGCVVVLCVFCMMGWVKSNKVDWNGGGIDTNGGIDEMRYMQLLCFCFSFFRFFYSRFLGTLSKCCFWFYNHMAD